MIGCSWVISPPQDKVEKWLTTPQNLIGAREEQLPKGRDNIPSKRGEKMLGRVKTIDVLNDLCALLRISLGVISWYPLPPQFSSAQFSRSVMSDSLRPHGLQQASLSCPSPTLGAYSNSCPSSRWCHPTISSSIVPFSSCPASGSFPMSQLCIRWPKYWSFRFNITPSNEHPGLISFRIDWFDLLAVQETLKSLLQYHSSKASNLQHSVFFIVQLTSIHDYWKNHSLD